MNHEMTPEQAAAKLQEIDDIGQKNKDSPGLTLMVKYLRWLMQDRIEQLMAIANQK